MRATELLYVAAHPIFCETYLGVYLDINKELYPVTNIICKDNRMVLFHDKELPLVGMSEFLKTLMLNKQLQLYYDCNELVQIFGFREQDAKLVLK